MDWLWLLFKIFGGFFCLFVIISIILLILLDKELGQPLKDPGDEQRPWYFNVLTKTLNFFECVILMMRCLVICGLDFLVVKFK